MNNWVLRTLVDLDVLAAVGITNLKSLGMFASDPVYIDGGLAIDGYDSVAYFTQGQPPAHAEQKAVRA